MTPASHRLMNPPPAAQGAFTRADGGVEVPVVATGKDGAAEPAHGARLTRTHVRVRMTGELLTHLLTEGVSIPAKKGDHDRQASRLVVRKGLPPGARVVGGGYDPARDWYEFVFEHEAFEPVPAGELPPVLPVEYDLVYDAAPGDIVG